MVWFKVDDKLHEHRKAHTAGKAAMGVWVLAGSWSADNGEGGFVPERVIGRWGTKRDAARLVEVGLWRAHEKDGERGWIFHEWEQRNPDEETVRAIKGAEKDGAALGNHRRWHLKRGVVADACIHCQASGADRVSIGVPDSPLNPPDPYPTRPDPTRLSVVTSVDLSSLQRMGIDADGLLKIALATGGDEKHAAKVAANILSTAGGEVRAPLLYVLSAIRKTPEAHRFRRGNPTKATACPQHPGEWADYCRIHASEARA